MCLEDDEITYALSEMKFERILREQMFVKGKFQDMNFYSILRREYYAQGG